jgi:hypothetical protein
VAALCVGVGGSVAEAQQRTDEDVLGCGGDGFANRTRYSFSLSPGLGGELRAAGDWGD